MKVAIVSTESLVTPPRRYGGIESMVYDHLKFNQEIGFDLKKERNKIGNWV